jgi:tRNA A-37 threonylcarbamoyl transferase component Bud32
MAGPAIPMEKSKASTVGEIPSGGRERPDELAAEYLSEQSAGASPRIETFLARLPDEEERREFLELVDGATRAVRGLPRTLALGSRIAGRYRITGELGGGGMGKVYAAHDEKLRRDVAVKVLAPLPEGNREREKLFEEEWRILAELNHPGIVAVHDAGNDEELTYIVMDLVDGTAMSDVVDHARRAIASGEARDGALLARSIGKPVPPGRGELLDPHDWSRSVARIIREISRTLEAAHGKHVIHRDLKPANVMLLGGGAPILLDFGLAGSGRTGSGDGGLHGSLPYVAPEQVESESQGMDPRTDVYQTGLILYELLTLKRAFPGTAAGDVLRRIRQGFFERPRKVEHSIPRDLEAICMKALEVDLSRRYASAKELRLDLEAWLEGRVPVASSGARWRSFVRTTRYTAKRHPALVTIAGMSLVALIAWFGFRVTDPGQETAFFRMVPEGKNFRIVSIRDRKQEVVLGDFLGFTLRTAGDVDVYALSVYGSADGRNFISPWKAADKNDLNRVLTDKTEDESWGLHVPNHSDPVTQIVCEKLRPQTPANTREGLLILVAPREEERKKIEVWMNRLLDLQSVGADVPWNDAVKLLTEPPPVARGGSGKFSKADLFDPIELENGYKALLQSEKKAAYILGIPNVEEYSIECHVAGT